MKEVTTDVKSSSFFFGARTCRRKHDRAAGCTREPSVVELREADSSHARLRDDISLGDISRSLPARGLLLNHHSWGRGDRKPTGFCVRSPGFSRPRPGPAKAGTPNRLATARFMGSFLARWGAHRNHESSRGKLIPDFTKSGINSWDGRFMGSFDLQFLDTHRGHEPDARSIAELLNSAMFAHPIRFMESFEFQFLDAHWGREPMQFDDQLLMHMHQKSAHAERPISARFMESLI